MNGGADRDKAEIVIVRRRSVDDGSATKAGAWKIAYADFVTAMMAFFLVMWLINASNEATRSQVASYFNPIKLTDSSTGARSLKDIKDTHNPQNKKTGDTAEGVPPSKKDTSDESDLLANPPKSLDRVARTVTDSNLQNAGLGRTVEVSPSLKPDKNNPGVGDPFDPKSWEKAKGTNGLAASVAEKNVPDADLEQDSSAKSQEPTPDKNVAPREAISLSQDIASRLGKSTQQLSKTVEVRTTGSGVMISLTESANFEMFRTGSAEPEPEMLKLVEAVAGALKSRSGNIIVRGHTDSRPYRNKYYDNWQLSTARANLARYMLIRGGLEKNRIRRVEGVADLEPKNAKDPQAPENRRIEIFIGEEKP
ncbi:flagellar motor protein MotB [Aestuariivirga sp.]|uniref:flagellar motor protein MotB n=1 Tax=Aestuariivirga sp. TaxID=2650926 RepID=UPI003016644D